MMTSELKPSAVQSRGFTLLEILVATAIFSILVGALYSLFYSALRARESTYESIEKGLPTAYALYFCHPDKARSNTGRIPSSLNLIWVLTIR